MHSNEAVDVRLLRDEGRPRILYPRAHPNGCEIFWAPAQPRFELNTPHISWLFDAFPPAWIHCGRSELIFLHTAAGWMWCLSGAVQMPRLQSVHVLSAVQMPRSSPDLRKGSHEIPTMSWRTVLFESGYPRHAGYAGNSVVFKHGNPTKGFLLFDADKPHNLSYNRQDLFIRSNN
jgi:hypothetical protein